MKTIIFIFALFTLSSCYQEVERKTFQGKIELQTVRPITLYDNTGTPFELPAGPISITLRKFSSSYLIIALDLREKTRIIYLTKYQLTSIGNFYSAAYTNSQDYAIKASPVSQNGKNYLSITFYENDSVVATFLSYPLK